MALVTKSECDVAFAGGNMMGVGMDIVSHLETKGFCVINPGLDLEDFDKARADVDSMDDKMYRPPELIVEGLFGAEGSARIMELETPDPEAPSTEGVALKKLDAALTETAAIMDEFVGVLGFECPTRTVGLVHETGMSPEDAPELGYDEASSWMSTFIRHKLMVIACLGPIKGTLELRPYDDEDAEVCEVPTNPGTIIVLRADVMTHRHFAHSKAHLLSCYLLEPPPATKYYAAMQDVAMVPVAREIHNWTMQQMKEIKEAEYELKQPAQLPASWLTAMNHNFHCVQRVAVRGMAGRYCSSYHVPALYRAMHSGPDFVTEIPLQRWSVQEYYDQDPEGWRWGKCFLQHGSFMEGADLFDSRFFGLSPSEAGGMDPHQREVLEVGYDALATAGYKKGKLMNSLGGVYLGSSMTIFGQVSTVSGATGGAASINSNRFSFCLGLKGPSLTCDTESSSALTAVYIGAEAVLDKGRGVSNAYSLSGGVAFQLGTIWWPQLQAARLLCKQGRCLTFDQSADGYCLADGCNFVVLKRLTEVVEGAQVNIEGEPLFGIIAGSTCNSNGSNASMNAPSGPAEQELVAEAVKSGCINPMNIDTVETNGQGAFMADAVEADSLMRVLRSQDYDKPLNLTSVKSQIGHGHECSGVIGLHKALLSNLWGTIVPNQHLRQINPHIEPESQGMFPTECMEYQITQSYTGVTARGFAGTNVHVITMGEVLPERLTPVPEEIKKDNVLTFWPGGGGELPEGTEPHRGYFIAGTWNKWAPESMQSDGPGVFGYTVTLGENRWEDFQILLDGDKNRALHPETPKAYKGAPIQGPDLIPYGVNWRIAGTAGYTEEGVRSIEGGAEEGALAVKSSSSLKVVNMGSADPGKVGDQYRVQLKVAGKFRTVTWEKIGQVGPENTPASEYFVTSNWNGFTFDKMEKEGDTYSLEVLVTREGGEFQIVRNEDFNQTICPTSPSAGSGDVGYGPDDGVAARGFTWFLNAKLGDVCKITYERSTNKVSWDKVREEKLSKDQIVVARRPRFCVVGSWSGWVRQSQLRFGGGGILGQDSMYYFFITIGPDHQESFQLLQDCDWDRVIHPNLPVPHPSVPHSFMLSPNDGKAMNLVWTIGEADGATPGETFMVKLNARYDRPTQVSWERATRGSLLEENVSSGGILGR